MVSVVGKRLERIEGFVSGDGVKDSAAYLDQHGLVVDAFGRGAGSPAFRVRGIDPRTNAPTEVFRVNKDGSVSWLGAPYDVRNFGAKGDGATDDTAAVVLAIAAAGPGVVFFPPGTFVVDALVLSAALTIRGAGPLLSTILHKANATADLFATTSDLDLADLAIDGNAANQATRRALLRVQGPSSGRYTLRRCRFVNVAAAVAYATDLSGALTVEECDVLSMAECPAGALSYPAVGVAFYVNNNVAPTNGGDIAIRHNRFVNPNAANNDRMPAAVQLNGAEVVSPLLSFDVSGNYVVNFGHCESGSGALMGYEYFNRAIFRGNRLYRIGHSALNVSNARGVVIDDNVVEQGVGTTAVAAIVYGGYGRPPVASVYHDTAITGNVVRSWPLSSAIQVSGGASPNQTKRHVVSGNVVENCQSGISFDGVGEVVCEGNVVDGCTDATTAGGGIRLANVTGAVVVRGGQIANGAVYGVYGVSGNAAMHLVLQGVAFDANTSYHVHVGSSASMHVADCRFLGGVNPLNATGATDLWLLDNVADAATVNLSSTNVLQRGNTWNGGAFDQGPDDGNVLEARSTGDVAHGMTTLDDTAAYLSVRKVAGATGGAWLRTYGEGTSSFYLSAAATTENATRTTGADAPIYLEGRTKSGTTASTMNNDQNILVVANNSSARLIVDTEGDVFAQGHLYPGTPATAFQTGCGLLAGSGVPSNSLGNNNDFYFRADGGAGSCLYHKVAGSWVARA